MMTSDAPAKKISPWWLLPPILVLAWVVYLVAFAPLPPRPGALPPPALNPRKATGASAHKWPLRDLEGKPADFAQFSGKTVFLNVWATWCRPCVEELPSIANLARNPRLKDVTFVCISTDDSLEKVR